jgi:hypothetical protein
MKVVGVLGAFSVRRFTEHDVYIDIEPQNRAPA